MDKEREETPEQINPQGSETNAEQTPAEQTPQNAGQEQDEAMVEQVDYSNYSKEELVGAIEGLLQYDQPKQYESSLNDIKTAFDEIENAERKEALDQFLETGGDKDAFDFKGDEQSQKFMKAYRTLRERRGKYYQQLEENRNTNLKAKERVLDQLREIVDAEETDASMDAIKKLQQEWKAIGQVPAAQVQELWANYNALMDRFYNQRSMYFELKELDRKKNLEAKKELVKRAEELVEMEDIREAVNLLNDLHEEYKSIGPVPREEQEALWQEFKASSDKVYDRRRAWLEELKKEQTVNLDKKKALISEVEAFLSFDSDRIKEWNSKTQELLEVQKKWEAVGNVPREDAKEVNRAFWGAVKGFFKNKSEFFAKLEEHRKENLAKKEALVKKAEELKDSTDWGKTVGQMKNLQAEWKKIGPVPEKQRESVYQEFKGALDHFFNRMREKNKAQESEFISNFEKKAEICKQLEEAAAKKEVSKDQLEELDASFREIGFVPRDKVKEIQQRYTEALNKYVDAIEGMDESEKQHLMLKLEFGAFKDDPSARRKVHQKESDLRKQINDIENDIATWKNNLAFFAKSKTADKLREEFDQKIAEANVKLKALKKQLDMLRKI